ncbi:collagen alpha-1(I) chain-like [Odocoileus virginianus]|uniref:Collagen alpha-1(I) chain-like n=1 Tax=Odocoileus virginianus TaxID=9874 RepID=A0A6J0X841_ODOVR
MVLISFLGRDALIPRVCSKPETSSQAEEPSQAADSGPPFPFPNAGAPKRKHRAWGSRKGAGQQIQQCTPKPYGGGRSAGALSRQLPTAGAGAGLRHRPPGPPPPGRLNSTPREGGADKGSGAARSAPDRLRHRVLVPDVGTLWTVGTSDDPLLTGFKVSPTLRSPLGRGMGRTRRCRQSPVWTSAPAPPPGHSHSPRVTLIASDCPLPRAASAPPARVSGQRSRAGPAEGAPALLTHRSPERRARAQPGTPRHVTARAGATREAGPARGTGVGREVAQAREGPSGSGHVTGVQAPPAAPPLAGASRFSGKGAPQVDPAASPSAGTQPRGAGIASRFRLQRFPGQAQGEAPASYSFSFGPPPYPTTNHPSPGSRAPSAPPPALC